MDKTEQPKICGAQLRKKPGSICQKRPVKGKRRCRLHGGKSPGGMASARFKHGRYSLYIPMDLRKRYEQSRHDPELLSHEPDLRLMDIHLQSLLKQLNKTEGLEAFAQVKKVWKEFQKAKSAKDQIAMSKGAEKIDQLFKQGVSADGIWSKIREVVETRRRILESENRRIRDSQATMSCEQVLGLVELVVDILRKSVQKYADRIIAQQILAQVSNDIEIITSKPHQAPPGIARLLA